MQFCRSIITLKSVTLCESGIKQNKWIACVIAHLIYWNPQNLLSPLIKMASDTFNEMRILQPTITGELQYYWQNTASCITFLISNSANICHGVWHTINLTKRRGLVSVTHPQTKFHFRGNANCVTYSEHATVAACVLYTPTSSIRFPQNVNFQKQ